MAFSSIIFLEEVEEVINSIRKNSEFQKVYKEGISYANKYLVMYVLPNECGYNQLGISVSKKVGNSVVRHRITRLIREAYRLNENRFNSSLNLVVVARVSAKDRSFQEIESAFLHLGRLHKIIGQ